MKILLIGGTGTISENITRLLVKNGHDVYLLNRGNKGLKIDIKESIICDVNDITLMKSKIGNRYFDVVVNFINYQVNDLIRDIELFKGNCSQYIFISSSASYKKPLPSYPITETSPIGNDLWDYGLEKSSCEYFLRSLENFPYTIVRPSHTYNEKKLPFIFNSRTKNYTLIQRMANNKDIIIPGGNTLWTLTHSSDFAKGFIELFGQSEAIGETFHITSDNYQTWSDILCTISKVFDLPFNPYFISSNIVTNYFPNYKGTLIGDKCHNGIFCNDKIKKLAKNFQCTTNLSNGFRQIKNYYEKNPNLRKMDFAFDKACDDLLENHKSLLHTI